MAFISTLTVQNGILYHYARTIEMNSTHQQYKKDWGQAGKQQDAELCTTGLEVHGHLPRLQMAGGAG